MHPIAFEFGNFAIRWYGVMAAVGFIVANFVIQWNRKKAKLSSDQSTTLIMLAMIFGVIGARIFYVIQFWNQFEGHFWRVFRVDQGGLVFYGGFFLALIAIFTYCKIYHLDVVRVMDVCAPALAIGHACGRIGCFLNGCCFGKPTEWLVGVVYPDGSAPFLRYGTMPLHPVQLYEAGLNILIFGVMLVLVKRGRGVALSGYIAFYGLMRFADEFFRGDHQQFFNGLTPAQTIGLVMIPAGLCALLYFRRHAAKRA